jgi:hypothetical protein
MKLLLIFLLSVTILVSVVSGQDVDPKLITMPEYALPPNASAAGIDGKVQLLVWVKDDGSVSKVETFLGPSWPCGTNPKDELAEMRRSLEATVKQARFSPALKDGEPDSREVLLTLLIGKEYEQAKKLAADKAAGKTPAENSDPKMIRGGVLNGKAISLPKPEYPTFAAGRPFGSVTIQLLIGEDGSVLSAGAVKGNSLLQYATRDAACKAKFSPTLLAGHPVKVSGELTYNFVPTSRPR